MGGDSSRIRDQTKAFPFALPNIVNAGKLRAARRAFPPFRGVAQSGSAPALGAGCRGFESLLPDHFSSLPLEEEPSGTVSGKAGDSCWWL